MDVERIAELIKKAEKNTLSLEEKEEINDNFKKAEKEWPERKRQLNEILYDYTEGQGTQNQKAQLNENIQEEHYKKLLLQREGRRMCCNVCGISYNFDNLNMCKECGTVYCYKCVWDSSKTKFRRCDCGGEID